MRLDEDHLDAGIAILMAEIFPLVGRIDRHVDRTDPVGREEYQDRVQACVEEGSDPIAFPDPERKHAVRQLERAALDFPIAVLLTAHIEENSIRPRFHCAAQNPRHRLPTELRNRHPLLSSWPASYGGFLYPERPPCLAPTTIMPPFVASNRALTSVRNAKSHAFRSVSLKPPQTRP